MTLKHYTYKVTFPGMGWYYWGVHTDNGKPYYGSPCTHKWRWDFYEFEIQILEWFECRKEAEEVETRLIKYTWYDPNCLNEHYSGNFTQEGRLRGIETQRQNNLGLFNPDNRADPSLGGKSGGKVGGKKTRDLCIGIHAPGVAQKGGLIGGRVSAELGHLQSNAREYGILGGAAVKVKGLGIHDPKYRASEEYAQMRREAGRVSGSIRYRCLVTGYEGIRLQVIRHQKKLGIDPTPENRVEIYRPPRKNLE